jgi:hypothetical protein
MEALLGVKKVVMRRPLFYFACVRRIIRGGVILMLLFGTGRSTRRGDEVPLLWQWWWWWVWRWLVVIEPFFFGCC